MFGVRDQGFPLGVQRIAVLGLLFGADPKPERTKQLLSFGNRPLMVQYCMFLI